MPSIFTQIINREIPAHILYENAHVIAFLDIDPVFPGHTLVVPKEESENLLSTSGEMLRHVFEAVQVVGPAVRSATGADALVISSNVGAAAGQSVFHTHVHVIPRYNDDGLSHWPHTSVTDEQLKEVAEEIRGEM